MLDSVVEAKKKYYPQTFLKECKYKMENFINDELEPSSSNDESNNETENPFRRSDSGIDNETNNESDNE